MNCWTLLSLALVVVVLCALPARGEEDVPYGVAEKPWPGEMGNHRACVRVAEKADAVLAHLPWRRRDPNPEKKGIVVVEAATGKRVANVAPVAVTREQGDVVFQAEAAGEYYVYVLPLKEAMVQWAWRSSYTPPEATAEPAWLERHGLTPAQLKEGKWRDLPRAQVLRFEARDDFHRFDPMEVVATAEETRALLERHPDEPYLLFPEDRRLPIRMREDLPLTWIRRGPAAEVRGEAMRGEFYAFQVGLYAARQEVRLAEIRFGDLRAPGGKAVPASALRCINLGGTDWLGRPLRKEVVVPRGKVQALWCGVQVPKDAAPGEYEGTLTLVPAGGPERAVTLRLEVTNEVAEDAGDGDLWRQARLRWLDSTIGLDDEVVAPYTPLKVRGRAVECLGRQVRFAETGLPESIRAGAREVLARPMAMVVETAEGVLPTTGAKVKVTSRKPGAVVLESQGKAGSLAVACRAKMECDGYIGVSVTFRAEAPTAVKDIRLEIPYRRDAATYLMGLGRKGGTRPKEWQWAWDARRANNTVWIGAVDAGLHCKLKGPADTWDIYNLTQGVPNSWGNGGKGGATVTEEGNVVLLRAFSGERTLQAGEEVSFRFGLLVTPVKPLDPAHWKQRYYHAYVPVEKAVESGANIINVHHGNEVNPNINYPFRRPEGMRAYVRAAHEKGVKVKIYYTVRELSNYTAELWALRSLGHEVFTGGGGGGHSWLQEHLVSDYAPAWHHPFPNGEVDAALAQQGLSRWHNYYLEGLRWLIRNVAIDGLYLDGIGYDREIMKRVRKVMDRERRGCLIDFHSGNEFPFNDLRVSPACKYLEHFPYIDSLWFGEMYDYNETPDYWLVEVSGIPFGLFGEMLQDNGNPWRGMIYGMAARYYSGADPKHVWKVWDDFGIGKARMLGYWSPECPVRPDRQDILATAYVRKGKTLVSVASWAKEPVRCRLKIDCKAVGLDPAKAHLYAPAIQGFQNTALFGPDEAIPISPGRGWLLVLDEEKRELPKPEDIHAGRRLLLEEAFAGDRLGGEWQVRLSPQPNTSLRVADGMLRIEAAANAHAYAERPLPPGTTLVECRVNPETDKGASWGPGLALVWPGKIARINLRAEGRLGVDDGAGQWFGGTAMPGVWHHLRVRVEKDAVLLEVSADEHLWEGIHAFPRTEYPGDPVALRLGKMSPRGKPEDHGTLGPAGVCSLKELRVWGKRNE